MNKALIIRTCNKDMTSYGGFTWAKEGIVTAPDWDSTVKCGGGLHGLIDGIGDYGLLSSSADAVWQIAEVDRDKCIELDGKVKFEKCNVIYTGTMAIAMTMISREWVRIALNSATTGEYANSATTGYRANSATTGEYTISATTGAGANSATTGKCANSATTGYRANSATTGKCANSATTGKCANSATTGAGANSATTGEYANSATTGYRANSATTGNCANSATTGYCANSATTGEYTISAALGNNSTASCGENGVLIIAYIDVNGRNRVKVGYTGEDGIEPFVTYKVENGEFVKV